MNRQVYYFNMILMETLKKTSWSDGSCTKFCKCQRRL